MSRESGADVFDEPYGCSVIFSVAKEATASVNVGVGGTNTMSTGTSSDVAFA